MNESGWHIRQQEALITEAKNAAIALREIVKLLDQIVRRLPAPTPPK